MRRSAKTFFSRLELSDAQRSVVANAGWLSFERLTRMAAGVLVGAWVARYLGPEQFGELSYVVAFIALFQALVKLGIDNLVVRDISRDKETASSILGVALGLRMGTALLCMATALVVMAILQPGDIRILQLTAIVSGTLLFQAADCIDLWFQSQGKNQHTVLAKVLALSLSSATRIALILSDAPLEAFAWAILLEAGLLAFVLTASYLKHPIGSTWRWDNGVAWRLVKEGAPYLISSIAIIVYMRIDQIMLREMVSAHEVGIYSAALPLSMAWTFIPLAICTSAAPTIAQLKAHSHADFMRHIGILFAVMWWITLPICILTATLSAPAISLLYGASYQSAAPVLAIHVFSNIPIALGVVQSQWLTNQGRGSLALTKALIGAASNISLNIALIPRYGAIGAAIATVISFFIAAVASNLFLAPNIARLQLIAPFRPGAFK